MQIGTSLFAVVVLHAFDVALPLHHQKARRGSVARAVTSKGQGVFHSAGHKDCCVVELATLLFLFFFWSVFCPRFFGCGRRRETHIFVFVRIAPQVAGRQTSLSHADRDFSLALALLHAVDVRVAGVATCKCQRGDFLSLSSAERLLAG